MPEPSGEGSVVWGWGTGGRGAEVGALVHGERRGARGQVGTPPRACVCSSKITVGSSSSRSSTIGASGQGHSLGCSSAPRGVGEAGGGHVASLAHNSDVAIGTLAP